MNYSEWREAWQLYARACGSQLERKIAEAQRLIRCGLARAKKPYVCFSGGKDSLVMLALVLAEKPDVDVMWLTSVKYDFPGTEEAIAKAEAHFGIHVQCYFARDCYRGFFQEFGVWPDWHKCDFSGLAGVFERQEDIIRRQGWDGAFVGLRKEESAQRSLTLRWPILQRQNYAGTLRICPLGDWTTQDIWAYIVMHKLPVHAAYARLIDAGVHPDHARTETLLCRRVVQYGSMEIVKRLWPEHWNALVAENPCMAAG